MSENIGYHDALHDAVKDAFFCARCLLLLVFDDGISPECPLCGASMKHAGPIKSSFASLIESGVLP